MKKLKEIPLTRFQLGLLLNSDEMAGFKMLLKSGVFCTHCMDICKKGVLNYTIKLDWLNNIVIDGECAACGQKVTRVMEFGENREFFNKAMDFREKLQN